MVKERPDHDFLAVVQRLQPTTVQELCVEIGVTATAIRQRLLRLQGDGLVARQATRQERGRPHHTYSLTSAGFKSLGDDHAEIAALLWREIMKIGAPEIRQQVLSGVKAALVQRFGVQTDGVSLAGRLRQLCENLSEHGFDVDFAPSVEGGLPVLREHNCPYSEIANEDAGFCDFEKAVFAELLGTPVELSACRLEGHHCCEFQVGCSDDQI
jgi:predicted ArsR family transcriptional regulator